jgi:hypothetical protein
MCVATPTPTEVIKYTIHQAHNPSSPQAIKPTIQSPENGHLRRSPVSVSSIQYPVSSLLSPVSSIQYPVSGKKKVNGGGPATCVIIDLIREGWGYLTRLVIVVGSEKEGGEPAAALSSVL